MAIALPLTMAALGAAAQADAPSTWAFTPPRDEFSADSLLDLRSLNERTAGETGFVRIDARGDFIRGDGQPIRFWAVNSDVARGPFVAKPLGPKTAPDLARHARFLAKRGVNLVRQHRQISPPTSAPIGDINRAERDAIWRMVAAMRTEGIYSVISPYWAGPMKFSKDWAVAGGADQSAFGLLFFDPVLQGAYKSWLKQLFTEKNPYSGVPLARDASVALVQIQNEDSLLFWTVGGIKGAQRAALETRFAQFAADKHGSVAKALAAGASAVIIDLEDAVAPPDKDAARASLQAWLRPEHAVIVRINSVDTAWFEQDLALCGMPGVAAVMVPKAESAAQLQVLDWVLTQLERERGLVVGACRRIDAQRADGIDVRKQRARSAGRRSGIGRSWRVLRPHERSRTPLRR